MYPGEQVVPFRIHYVNLGEKVLKPRRRQWSERRCDNRVIHPAGAGCHLRCVLADHIPPGRRWALLQVNKYREHMGLIPRNTFGQST